MDTRLDHINDNLDKTKLENDERVSGFISDLKSLEEIVKNLKNENNQIKEDFKKLKNIGKWYCRLNSIVYYWVYDLF